MTYLLGSAFFAGAQEVPHPMPDDPDLGKWHLGPVSQLNCSHVRVTSPNAAFKVTKEKVMIELMQKQVRSKSRVSLDLGMQQFFKTDANGEMTLKNLKSGRYVLRFGSGDTKAWGTLDIGESMGDCTTVLAVTKTKAYWVIAAPDPN